ncbi:MAG: cobalamin B12-binding domain-containing protein [Pseudomonadota bacterium]
MSDDSSFSARGRSGALANFEASFDEIVAPIASQAIAEVAIRLAPLGSMDETALSKLEAAVFHDARERRIAVVDAMRAAGLTERDIVDRYIPEVADRLGEHWLNDTMTFADVTIGAARLQAMVRDVAADAAEPTLHADAASALVVVRRGETHTLGAVVLATQLRRCGVAVRLSIGHPDEDVAAEARYGDYNLIAISASAGENLDSLRSLVKRLRKAAGGSSKIAVGGSVMDLELDLEEALHVDFATKNAVDALRRCDVGVSTTRLHSERFLGVRDKASLR